MKRLLTIYFLATVLTSPALAAEGTQSNSVLQAAKNELKDLRIRYQDKDPRVQAQLQKIEELERQAQSQPTESAELRRAREELVELRQRYEDQVRKVEKLERQAKRQATESAELRAAREEFARRQRMYKERHPRYQEALRRVQDLERQEQKPQ